MTYMRAWMSLKFGEIRLLVSMATDRVVMEKAMLPLFMPPILKKWGTYWFRLVRLCVFVCVYSCS